MTDKQEEARGKFWERMTDLVREYDLYTWNPNIKEMERDLMDAYDDAIAVLTEVSTPPESQKQV